MSTKSYQAVVCGSRGYVGQELVRLVQQHPALSLYGVHSRTQQDDADACLSLQQLEDQIDSVDILLLATPVDVSMQMVKKFSAKDVFIIDLSGAFRLPLDLFQQWYGVTHSVPECISQANYGLHPWNQQIGQSNLVANPGCYATSVLMALIPLLKQNLIQADDIIIDAKSGVSGAGKKERSDLMFAEMNNNFFSYKVGKHQHVPEIQQCLNQYTATESQLHMTTHMLPIFRGIASTIYVKAQDKNANDDEILNQIAIAYKKAYHEYPLIAYHPLQNGGEGEYTALKKVIGTAKTQIGYFVKDARIILFSNIDNLLKGAASQAIENINVKYDLPIAMGLINEGQVA